MKRPINWHGIVFVAVLFFIVYTWGHDWTPVSEVEQSIETCKELLNGLPSARYCDK